MKLNVGEILQRRARRDPGAEAVVDLASGRRFSFADLDERANRSAGLLSSLGVGSGDRVAVLAKNSPEFLETFFGCAKAGMVLVPLNWRLVADELEFILQDCGAVALLFDGDFAGVAEELRGRGDATGIRHWVQIGAGPVAGFARHYDELLAAASPAPPPIAAEGDDLLHIMYTSGTTGLPKGAVHTHASGYWSSINGALTFDLRTADRYQLCLPMFHIGALFPAQAMVHVGAASVILREFDPALAWRSIDEERITGTFFVPAMVGAMLACHAEARPRSEHLRWAWSGAAPVPLTSIQAFFDLGIPVWQLYALTESYGVGTACTAEQSLARPGTAGQAYFLSDVKVVGPDLADLPAGTQGEILLRGPHLMAGYWGRPDATAETLHRDADGSVWLRTGDAGVVDGDGFVYVRDRIKDMLISGGENVYPAEIENVILAHPAVREVAVIGVPSARWGESPLAVVVRNGNSLTEADVVAWCEGKLGRFKLPKVVRFVDAIPRNPSGKVLKRVLRDEHPVVAPE